MSFQVTPLADYQPDPAAATEARLSALEERISQLEKASREQAQNDRDAYLMIVAHRERELGLRPKERRNAR